jgi:hypothetical protein
MNKYVISPDALIRFRNAASQIERGVAPRASRWLILKDDIAALRKRGFSYRTISDLLSQNGINASPTGLMRFCRRVLKEKRSRKPTARQRPSSGDIATTPEKSTSVIPAKTSFPSAPVPPKPATTAAGTSAFTSRGPRIAKVELLPPGETI